VIAVLNVGRFLMVAWIVYALLLVFAPGILHSPPAEISGAIQAVVAFVLGHLMDRALSVIRRRRAERSDTGLAE
jgi:hypothetical protein